jgi:ribosomal protein S18 acetylase RimI-like enzyme
MSEGEEFIFSVEGSTGERFALEFRLFDSAAQPWFTSVWQRMSAALQAAHKEAGTTAPDWVQWQPWKWCEKTKPGYENRRTIIGWCGSQIAGFLNVWKGFESQVDAGDQTLYIEHLAAAPWNLNTELWRRQYGQIGTALLAYAVKVSQDEGLNGRVSLHASNDSALTFYRNVGNGRSALLYFPEKTGVLGPTPHAGRNDSRLTFLEMTPEGAIDFLEDYRHE